MARESAAGVATAGCRLVVVFRDDSGTLVHEEEVGDFLPLYHDIAFDAVCRGRLPNDGRWGATAVEPSWEEGRFMGITARLAEHCKAYGLAMFAERTAEILLGRGLLKDGEREQDQGLSWTIEARRVEQTGRNPKFRRAVRRQPYPLRDRAECPTFLPAPTRQDNLVSVAIRSVRVARRVASGVR